MGRGNQSRSENVMPARTPRRSTVLGILVGLAVAFSVIDTTDAQVPAPALEAAPADGPRGDQPQLVSTGTGTFQKSLGYFFVALLAGGSLYAVCRTSHRT